MLSFCVCVCAIFSMCSALERTDILDFAVLTFGGKVDIVKTFEQRFEDAAKHQILSAVCSLRSNDPNARFTAFKDDSSLVADAVFHGVKLLTEHASTNNGKVVQQQVFVPRWRRAQLTHSNFRI